MTTPSEYPTDFKQHVVDSLARLETQIYSLIGNGQPGRISTLEGRVDTIIIAVIVLAVLILGPAAIKLFL